MPVGSMRQTDGSDCFVGIPAGGGPVVSGTKYRMECGSASLAGSNPNAVTTGLTVIVAAGASIKASAAPGVSTSVLTVSFAANGTLNVYEWMPTSNANPTLVASTGTDTFVWWAIGY